MTNARTSNIQAVTHAIYFELGRDTTTYETLIIAPTPMLPYGYGSVVYRETNHSSKGHWKIIPYGTEFLPTDHSRSGTILLDLQPKAGDPLVMMFDEITLVLSSLAGEILLNPITQTPQIALLQVSASEFIEMGFNSNPTGGSTPYRIISRAQDVYDAMGNNTLGAWIDAPETVFNSDLLEWLKEASSFSWKFSGHEEVNGYIGQLIGSSFSDQVFDNLDKWVPPIGRIGSASQTGLPPTTREDPVISAQYIRPNGETYYAREWSGREDVEVLKTAREYQQYPLLYGPPGTGKNALVEAAFGEELITIMITGDTEVSDLVGQFIPNPNHGVKGSSQPEYIWVDGPLVRAATEGRPVLLDEIGLGDPKMLSVVYSLMDGRRELQVTMNPDRGVIAAADGFFVLGATNPNAPGVQMSEALLSRFNLHVEVLTDWSLAITKLDVPERITGVAQALTKMMYSGEISWAPQMRELLTFKNLENIFGEDFALANIMAACPPEDRALVQARVKRVYGTTALAARIGSNIPVETDDD